MSLVWHLALKDLRRFRWALLFWAMLVGAKLVIGALLLQSWGDPSLSQFDSLAGTAEVLRHLERIAGFLLAAIVLEDPLVGNSAFWLVRPISGARLLASKALVLALCFVVLPLVVTLPWWLFCDFNARQIAEAAGETIAFHAPVLLAAWFLAAIAEGLPQALGRAVVGGGICLGTAALEFALRTSARGVHDPSPPLSYFLILGSAAALIMILHQYLARRSVRTIWLAALLLVAFTWLSVRPPNWANAPHPIVWASEDEPAGPLLPYDDPAPPLLRLHDSELVIGNRRSGVHAAGWHPAFCVPRLKCRVEGLADNEWLAGDRIALHCREPGGVEYTGWLRPSPPLWKAGLEGWRDGLPLRERVSEVDLFRADGSWEMQAFESGLVSAADFEGYFQVKRLVRRPLPLESQRPWRPGSRLILCEKTEKEIQLLVVQRKADFSVKPPTGRSAGWMSDAKELRLVQPTHELVHYHDSFSSVVRIENVLISRQRVRFWPSEKRHGPFPKHGQVLPFAGAQLVELRVEDGPRFRLRGTVDSVRQFVRGVEQ